MSIKRFKIDKLIRDGILEVMRDKGYIVHEKSLDHNEFIAKLMDKLFEEADEVAKALSKEELMEELADMLEVMQALSEASGITLRQLEEKRLHKRAIKGGFDRKIYTPYIDIEESNPEIDYYLVRSQQYPEMKGHCHRPDCLFCQISGGKTEVELFANFTHCYVIKDKFPVSEGHLLIIPHEHTENWFTASEEIRQDMMRALHLMKERLDLEYGPDGYNIGANCGEAAGQTVMHLHMHIIPRYLGDMADPKGGVRGVIPSKQKYCSMV